MTDFSQLVDDVAQAVEGDERYRLGQALVNTLVHLDALEADGDEVADIRDLAFVIKMGLYGRSNG